MSSDNNPTADFHHFWRASYVKMSKAALLHCFTNHPNLDEHLVEEVVSDSYAVLLRKWEERRHLDSDANCGYLFGTIRNMARGLSKRRRRELADSDLVAERMLNSLSLEHLALIREQEREAFRAIASLPSNQQHIMVLTLAEFTPTEIAKALDLKVGQVRTRLHRARGRVQRAVGEA